MIGFSVQKAVVSLVTNAGLMVFAKMLLFLALSITILLKEKFKLKQNVINIQTFFPFLLSSPLLNFLALGPPSPPPLPPLRFLSVLGRPKRSQSTALLLSLDRHLPEYRSTQGLFMTAFWASLPFM